MKSLFISILLLLTSCATANRTTYQTLASVVITADGAMKVWVSYVVDEREAIVLDKIAAGDDIIKLAEATNREATLLAKMVKIDAALAKYQAVILPAAEAAKTANQVQTSIPAQPTWLTAVQALLKVIDNLRTT